MMNELMIKTEGMACGKCESRVIAKLSQCPGVSDVKASAGDGMVSVSGEGLDRAVLEEAIEELGFDVIG